jgi:hypothetical protein
MKQLAIIFLMIFCLANASVLGQDNAPKVLIMGVPQYMIKNGIRLDIDIPTKDYKSWWVIMPQFYVDVNQFERLVEKKYEQLHGYGLSIHRKGFLTKTHPDQGVYISGGIGAQHFNLLTNTERWANIDDNGLNVIQLTRDNYHVYINKVLTEVVIGYQKEITSRLYVDFYGGFGLRYSFYNQPSGSDLKFNKNITDFGYTGTSFVGGIRIGVGI